MYSISTEELKKLLAERPPNAMFIDVRTAAEYRGVHIEGVENMPLDTIEKRINDLRAKERIYVHCKSGSRSDTACRKLEEYQLKNIFKVEGGIDKWIQEKQPVIRGKSTLSLMRQVQIAAGGLVLLGVILGFTLHAGWFLLSGFVGAGLLFAGLTGTCGMAALLSKMPWNQ